MSKELNIGEIITNDQQRDAVHMAVAPVVAGGALLPGNHVAIRADGSAVFSAGAGTVGIVDPFLRAPVRIGQRFWLFLYPGSITSLRHDWSHPAFHGIVAQAPDVSPEKNESMKWLEAFAESVGWNLTDLLERAESLYEHGSMFAGDDDSQEKFNASQDLLLRHLAIVKGREIPNPEDVYFRCAC